MGDVVCTLPAAVALKQTFPDSEVVWCVDRRFAGIVELCSAVDKVAEIPDGEFDVAFDLQGLIKSALVVARAKAKTKLGYHWQREGSFLFSQRVKPDTTSLHVTDQYVDVVRAAGATMERAEFGLVPKDEDIEKVKQLLPQGDFVVCNAGAGWATKRWPAEHFKALAEQITNIGLQPVFIGAPADRAVFEEVQATQAVDLVGKTSVSELVALISLARAHVGGDTGSTHIAAALGVPAIGLYSVTRPERSCPYGQRHNTLYDPASLANISPDQALATLKAAVGLNG